MLSNRRVAIINQSIMTVLFSIIDRSIMTVVDNDHYRPVDNGKQYCHYRPVVVLSFKLLRPPFTKHYRPAHMRMRITYRVSRNALRCACSIRLWTKRPTTLTARNTREFATS